MSKARERPVSLAATPCYHCVSRCVRCAFLCGTNHDGSCSFAHRRALIEERIWKLAATELKTVLDRIEQWRRQLMDVSWFMRNINEPIARQPNDEDNCTGRLWSRFLLLQNQLMSI